MHEYWLYREPDQIADKLIEFHDNWHSWQGSPFKQMWLRNYLAYYSPVIHPGSWDTSMMFEGEQGELMRFYTPKARTLIRQLTAVVTKQRMAFKASARTTGAEVLNEVKLGNALADQIVLSQELDLKADKLCEGGLVTGIWFTKATWRTDQGEPRLTDEDGRIIRKGACEITVESPFNVFWDLRKSWEQNLWAECRVKRNKWDLIAEYKDLEKEILALPPANQHTGGFSWADSQSIEDDEVFVYEFYHRPSPSLPNGMIMIYSDSETIYQHGNNPYGTIPIEPNVPEAVLDTGVGYAKLTDLAGLQEMFDNNLSSIATNQSQFAVQGVTVPRGSNINVQEINGMRFMNYTPQQVEGGGKPEPMQLTKTAPEVFKFTDKLEDLMQDMSYLNGAMTGNLPAGVSSGTAIATLSANSIEFITSISKSNNLCWEKTMMHAVNAYKKFAKIEQSLEIAGKGGQISKQEFKGDDVYNVSRMKLETVNPLLKTFAGRLEIGEKMLQMPKEIWPEYSAILEGRPLSEVYKGELSEFDLITQENEALENGEAVPVLAVDDHPEHIKKHADCLKDIGVRMNGKALEVILKHMMEHYEVAQMSDPTLMAMIQTGKMPEGGLGPPPGAGGPPSGPPQKGGGGPSKKSGRPEPGLGGGRPRPSDAPQKGGDRPRPISPVGDVAQPSPDLLQRG
jgi:hypothetical protein